MTSLTGEQVQQMIDALNQQLSQAAARAQQQDDQIQQLIARSTVADEAHRKLHEEMLAIKTRSTSSEKEFRLVDPKTKCPVKLGSDKAISWKQWSEETRAYVENLSVKMAKLLKEAEGREEALTDTDLEQVHIPEQHAAQMSRFLRLNTDGHANNLVKASVERCEHALETWRILSKEFDPKGLGTELVELSDLVSPAKLRAKTPARISVQSKAGKPWSAELKTARARSLTIRSG